MLYGSQSKNTAIGYSNLWTISKRSAGLKSMHPRGSIPDFNYASDISISTVNILYWRENVRTLPRKLFHSFIVKKDVSATSFSTLLIFFLNDGEDIK